MAELKGTILDDEGDAVSGATINLYAKGTTSPSLANAESDSSGEWEIGASGSGSDGAASVAYATRGEFDLKITNGSDIVWLLHRDRYQVDMVQASNATTVIAAGEFTSTTNEASTLVTIFEGDRATMADNDEAYNSYKMSDSGGTQEEVARVTWHQYDVNPSADGGFEIEVASAGTLYKVFDAVTATGGAQTVSIGTGLSATAITLGHSTSEVTVADNLTVAGNLTVTGTTITVDTVTMNAANAVVFEGATADGYETTLTIEDPTADRTVVIPNVGGTLAVLAVDSDTAITATPAEINLIDGGTARGTDAIADGDGVLINDDGTMKMTTVQTLATYMEGEINAFSLGLTLSGATTFSNTVTVGVDDTGYDVKFFGATASAFMLWDESEDDLVLSGTAQLSIDTATDATNTTSGSFHTDGGVGIAKKLYVGTDLDVAGTSNIEDTVVLGTLTVGVDDTGHDVKFFGASAGAYMEWDESADQLRIMGASADATTSTGKLLLATSNTDVNANDVIGKIDFQAPHETGTDAITVAASIQAIAQGTFGAAVNATDLIFYTGHSEVATEKFRFTSEGELGIGGATYGSSGDVLTSGGAGAAPTWATPTTGDITGVTAGVGLSGGGSSGGVTLTLDLSELSTVTPADGDFFSTLDSDGANEQKTTTTALATLLAGTGLTASSSVIGVDAAQTQITSVGTIGTGVWQGTAIASGYIAADAITGAKIADDAIDSEHYTDGSIDNAHLADDAVDSDELAAGAVDTAHIADNQITLAKMAGGTDGNIISYDASGDPVAIATGSDGQVLTSTGAGSPPAFEDAGGGGETFILKSSDGTAVNNTTTYASDSNLTFAVAANKHYRVHGVLFFKENNVTAKSQWSLPTNATWYGAVEGYGVISLYGASTWPFIWDSEEDDSIAVYLAYPNRNLVNFDVLITTGDTSGTAVIQYGQLSAVATDTFLTADSWMAWQLLD